MTDDLLMHDWIMEGCWGYIRYMYDGSFRREMKWTVVDGLISQLIHLTAIDHVLYTILQNSEQIEYNRLSTLSYS